jgi:hypothetical protein
MNLRKRLEAVLCDQEGRVCIEGSDEDRKIIQKCLNEILKLETLADKYDAEMDAGEYWDSGNFDDCFELGCDFGANSVYGEIKKILEQGERECES